MVWFLLITLAPGHEAIMRGKKISNFWKNGVPSLTFTKRPVAFIRRGSLSHPLEWLASNFFLQCNYWITQLSRKNLLIVWHILVRTTRDVWRTVCRIHKLMSGRKGSHFFFGVHTNCCEDVRSENKFLKLFVRTRKKIKNRVVCSVNISKQSSPE